MASLVVRSLKALLAFGALQIRRVPSPLLRNPDAELRLDLRHAVAELLQRLHGPEFFFVQVGGFDGTMNDPIHDLVIRYSWRGVVVEPQPEAFEALRQAYRDHPNITLCNAAIDSSSEPRYLFRVAKRRNGLPPWVDQIASFQRETVSAHRDVIPDIEELIEKIEVPCTTFSDILRPFGSVHVNLLQVDCEGYDDAVVKLFMASGYQADIICFEHKHLDRTRLNACYSSLIDLGYRLALCGPDTIACRGD